MPAGRTSRFNSEIKKRRLTPRICTPEAIPRMARRRASQRWWDLLHSRISSLMRPILDEALWKLFVLHANNQYKKEFLSAFHVRARTRRPPLLGCVGKRDGTPCPKSFKVDLQSPSAYDLLEELNLDREQDVRVTHVRHVAPRTRGRPRRLGRRRQGRVPLPSALWRDELAVWRSLRPLSLRPTSPLGVRRVLPKAPPAALHQCAQRGPLMGLGDGWGV